MTIRMPLRDKYGVGAHITAVKIMGANATGRLSDIIAGIASTAIAKAAAAQKESEATGRTAYKGSVIKMSLAFRGAISAVQQGIHVVVAAGDDNGDAHKSTPGSAERAIVVGASMETDARAYFSNHGVTSSLRVSTSSRRTRADPPPARPWLRRTSSRTFSGFTPRRPSIPSSAHVLLAPVIGTQRLPDVCAVLRAVLPRPFASLLPALRIGAPRTDTVAPAQMKAALIELAMRGTLTGLPADTAHSSSSITPRRRCPFESWYSRAARNCIFPCQFKVFALLCTGPSPHVFFAGPEFRVLQVAASNLRPLSLLMYYATQLGRRFPPRGIAPISAGPANAAHGHLIKLRTSRDEIGLAPRRTLTREQESHKAGSTHIATKVGPVMNFRVFQGVLLIDSIFTVWPEHMKQMLATDFNNYVKDGRIQFRWRDVEVPSRNGRPRHDIFDAHAEDVTSIVKERIRAGFSVDFQDLVGRFTMDSATKFLFGTCVDSLKANIPYTHSVAFPPTQSTSAHAQTANRGIEMFNDAMQIIAQREWIGAPWSFAAIEKKRLAEGMALAAETLLNELLNSTSDTKVLKDETLNTLLVVTDLARSEAGRDTTMHTTTMVITYRDAHQLVTLRPRSTRMYACVSKRKYYSRTLGSLKSENKTHIHNCWYQLKLPANLGRLPSLIGEPAGGSLTADQPEWLIFATVVPPLADALGKRARKPSAKAAAMDIDRDEANGLNAGANLDNDSDDDDYGLNPTQQKRRKKRQKRTTVALKPKMRRATTRLRQICIPMAPAIFSNCLPRSRF
ncbi:hypothetical protein C8R47DRAFT_1079854 [Mycena vitilis]|nr:hypothetical protein C8R47DRAFT_1079854 [Mycena vitilis]